MAEPMTPWHSLHDTLFGVRKSVRYHQRRRAFFEGIATTIATLQIASSSYAVLLLLGARKDVGAALLVAGTAGLLAAVNLAVGTQRRATLHASLAQRFSTLERTMVPHEFNRCGRQETVDGFRQQRLDIEEDEPPKLRVIDVLCHNELATATGRGHTYPFPWWKRALGHFMDMEVTKETKCPVPVIQLDTSSKTEPTDEATTQPT